jgi:hypothetical protein
MNEPVYLQPAPRKNPLQRSVFWNISVISRVFWSFITFGMLFFWVFEADLALITFSRYSGEMVSGKGIILETEETRTKIDGYPVYSILYSFVPENGEAMRGTSYITTTFGRMQKQYQKGTAVAVEYKRENPSISRIKGGRPVVADITMSFILLAFPFFLLLLLTMNLLLGRKNARLFSSGLLTRGSYISKEPTNVFVNDERLYRLTYEYETVRGEKRSMIHKTTDPDHFEERETVLYLPQKSSSAILLKSIPGKPYVNGNGLFDLKKKRGWKNYLLPGFISANILLFALFRVF